MSDNAMIRLIIDSTKKERIAILDRFEREKKDTLRTVERTTIHFSDLTPMYKILSQIKLLCENLFSSCEGLIRTFHTECSAQVDAGTPSSLLKEIADEMKEIVDASHLSLNFDGMLDGMSLGNMGKFEYTASMEAQSIAKMWESKYRMSKTKEEQLKKDRDFAAQQGIAFEDVEKHRAYLELEKKRKTVKKADDADELRKAYLALDGYLDAKAKAAEMTGLAAELYEKEKLEREEQRRKELAEKAAEEERKIQLAADKKEYEEAVARWQEQEKQTNDARSDELARRRESRGSELTAAYEKTFAEEKAAAEQALTAAQSKKKKAEQALAALGAFRFGEKKEQKERIAAADAEIAAASQKLSAAAQKRDKALSALTGLLDAFTAEQATDVEKQFPLPPQPPKPASMLAAERAEQEAKEREEREAKEKERRLISAILTQLSDGWHSTGELRDMLPEELRPADTKELSRLCFSLCQSGELKKTIEQRRTYFTVN